MNRQEKQYDPVILVIDDDVEITDFLTTLLKTAAHEIIISHDGIAGFDKARKYKPDLILLNVNIPRMDGREVCRLLKADEATASSRVIMMTGSTSADVKHECMLAGADDFINKPFNLDSLIEKINHFLKAPVPA